MTAEVLTPVYIRHRDRMVQESVFQDLRNTLIACRWMVGTATRPVVDPANPGMWVSGFTTTEKDVLKLVGRRTDGSPASVVLIDYFPEAEGDDSVAGVPESSRTELNTLAIDDGQPGDAIPMELGSDLREQPYRFNMAFYASSDAVAKAVLNDLRDRYAGDIVSGDFIDLFDYNTDPTTPVLRMEVESFQYTRDVEQVAQHEVHLYYAQLMLIDFVGPSRSTPPADFSPSLKLTGDGELAALGQRNAADFTGSGTTAAVGTARFTSSQNLAGSGTLVAKPEFEPSDFTFSVSLAGSGELTASGVAAFSDLTSTVNLSGEGSLATSNAIASSTSDLTGSGTITATGVAVVESSVSLTGSGTLVGSGEVAANYEGSANLTGSGTLSAVPASNYTGSASLTGSGTLTASGMASTPRTVGTVSYTSADHSRAGFFADTAIDKNGNTYVVGNFAMTGTWGDYSLTSAGQEDIYVAKMSPTGTWLWARRAGGTSTDWGMGVAVDSVGDVTIVGEARGSASFGSITLTGSGTSPYGYVAKLSSAGDWLWARAMVAANSASMRGADVDGFDNVLISGSFEGSLTLGAITLSSSNTQVIAAKISKNGDWIWASQGGSGSTDQAYDVVVDASGNVLVAGYFSNIATFGATTLSSAGSNDGFVAKLSRNGDWLWAVRCGGTGADYSHRVWYDGNDDVLVCGVFAGTASFGATSLTSAGGDDAFVAKLSGSDGAWLWAKGAGSTGADAALGLGVDAANNVVISGWFTGSATFGPTTLTSAGAADTFVAKLTPAGDWFWARRFGSTGEDKAYALAVDGASKAVAYGNILSPGKVVVVNADFESSASLTGSGTLSATPAPKLSYEGAWQAVTAMPTSREALGGASDTQGRVYAIGGYDSVALSNVERYDPATNAWSALAALPTARFGLAAVASKGLIYAIGGHTGASYSTTVQRYDPATNVWTTLPALPTARSSLGAAVDNEGRVYAIGGYNGSRLSKVERYDPATNAWTTLPDLPQPPRNGLGVATDAQGRIYAIGGFSSTTRLTQVDRYDPATNTWTTLAPLPDPARSHLAGAATDDVGLIYVIGGTTSGSDAGTLGNVDRYDPATNTWSPLTNINTPRWYAAAAVDAKKRIYIMGGRDGAGAKLNTVERLGE